MSSSLSDSGKEEPKRPGEFIFTWSIHNYSYCTLKEKYWLRSPEFVTEFFGNVKWFFQIYPSGSFISFYLFGDNQQAACEFKFFIRKANGQIKEVDNPTESNSNFIGHRNFLSLEKLKEIVGGYLIDDTLTLGCRMWKTDVDIPASVKWNAHSRIRTSKLDYIWILNDIEDEISNNALIISNQTKEITKFFVKIPSLKIRLLNEGLSGEDSIHFGIEMGERNKEFYFFICLIHFLDMNGRIVYSSRGEHLFEPAKPTANWNFPIISKDELNLNKNVFLHEGKLSLKCELGFSSDNILETFEYGRTYDIEKLEQDSDGQQLWVENMRECFSEGEFSDFILRTPEKQFPVHKAILRAHSEVFGAMFERDMKERNSGVVEIDDLDDDTVSQMLTFLYTNTIEDLNCTSAQKLYFAADKYRIKPLLKKCSNHLKCGLDVSNVCHILDLADRHQDHELKSRARDFIGVHTREIIVSDMWQKLMETNPRLIAEVLQSIACNKLL